MEDVRLRIREILRTKGITINALAKSNGALQKTLNNQINATTAISASTILLVLKQFPDVSAEWLLRGAGSMLIEQNNCNIYVGSTYADYNIDEVIDQNRRLKREIDGLYERIDEIKGKCSAASTRTM